MCQLSRARICLDLDAYGLQKVAKAQRRPKSKGCTASAEADAGFPRRYRLGALALLQSLGILNAADMMVALLVLGAIRIVMALGIKQEEARLLRWRPEYQKR